MLTIEDGEIARVDRRFNDDNNEEAIELFSEWMTENHPEDAFFLENTPYIDPEAQALWREYVPEFLATLEE